MADCIEKSVELNVPVDRVWRALTDHQEFGQWFKVHLDQPFVPGKESTGQMTYPGYEHMPWKAEIVALDKPRLFSFRWPQTDEKGEVREDWAWTLVEFRLEPAGNGTRLTVIESGFDALPAHRRAESYRMNEGGWAEQVENIKAHVEA